MTYARRALALIAALMLAASTAKAEPERRLVIAVGLPGSDSFAFGTELWAMGEMVLAPKAGIWLAAREVDGDEDRLSLLLNSEVEAALVHSRIPASGIDGMRAIMTLWPGGIVRDGIEPVQFLVRREIDERTVYRLTEAVFDHADMLISAHASHGIASPHEAMASIAVPLHPGATRYYRERGVGHDAEGLVGVQARETETAESASSSATYRNLDDAALGENEIRQIIAACRHALEAGSLSSVLGDLDRTGCEAYTHLFIDTPERSGKPDFPKRRQKIELASTGAMPRRERPDDGRGDHLFGSPGGQGGPVQRWTRTDEGGWRDRTTANDRRRPVM